MIEEYIEKMKEHFQTLIDKSEDIIRISKIIKNANTIFVCGNGGSSATASHFVNDLQKICKLRAISLTDNIPLITAWSNDTSYNNIFKKQLSALGKKDDLLILFSGSGNSSNLSLALVWALEHKMKVVAFIGMEGGEIKVLHKRLKQRYNDNINIFHIESDMQHSEDIHVILCHIITNIINE